MKDISDGGAGRPNIKVMSFNMKRNYLPYGKHRWENRAALVARVIRENHPDILGTQELTAVSLSDLQRLLPEYQYVGQGRDGGENGEFSAIFFLRDRWKLVFDETFWLSDTPNQPSRAWLAPFRRICTTCRLESLHDSYQLQIYNTHLDHISYLARVNGLKLILRHMFDTLRHYGKVPVVLMGDFNATPTSRTLRSWERHMLSDASFLLMENSYHLLAQTAGAAQSAAPGRSYHGFRGAVEGSPIDYIFTSRDLLPRAVEIRRESFGDAFPSDHYPVVAELELVPPPAPIL